MLSKNQVKLIRSLGQKKNRQELGLFVVEGMKGIREFIASDFELINLYANDHIPDIEMIKVTQINTSQLQRISYLKTPNKALALFRIPERKWIGEDRLTVVLDSVRDPGNLGTIIRLCDWFGVENLVCSPTTVDCFNPKVVQASMGSLARVNIHYLDLKPFLASQNMKVFGTYMQGESIYNLELPSEGIIIFGNEANGISPELEEEIDRKLSIPQFGLRDSAESLNVANATAIIISEFRRRTFTET